MTKEFLVTSSDSKGALDKLMCDINKYRAKFTYLACVKYLIQPEIKKYGGKNKKLRGKWRAYARIKVSA